MSNTKSKKRKTGVGKVQASTKASRTSNNGRPDSGRDQRSKPQLVARSAAAVAAPQRFRATSAEPEREVHTIPADSRPLTPSPVSSPQQEGRYVYGVIQARDSATFGKTGIGGSGELVYTVHHGDIAAIVSKTAVFIFDPTRENALAHEHVIETVMKAQTIIPMSFGTVFRTDEDIREVLKSIYPSLKDVLKQMEGKLEFGLKVTWDREQVIDELKRDDEEIHRFHQEITRKHLQSTYLARMQLGRMIDKALVERSAQYVREIYDALRSVCVASRDNKPIGDKMIMNAAFLIEKAREADFDAAVNRIARKFGDRLNFKYTGPWPPYNFVNIRLKLERGTAS
jgi:hypothetical protein